MTDLGPSPTPKEFAAEFGLTPADFESAKFKFIKRDFTVPGHEKPINLDCVQYPYHLPSGRILYIFRSLARQDGGQGRRLAAASDRITPGSGFIGHVGTAQGRPIVLAGSPEDALAYRRAGFVAIAYESVGKPLSDGQIGMLAEGEPTEIVLAFNKDPEKMTETAEILTNAGMKCRMAKR